MDNLQKNNIELNRKVLADLSAFEPATFEALAKIASENDGNNDENNSK